MNRDRSSNEWTRREFLALVGSAALAQPRGLFAADVIPKGTVVAVAGTPFLRQRYRLLRPRDLLAFDLELLNLDVVRNPQGKPQLEIVSHAANGFVVFQFTGQHIAEQAIWDRGQAGQAPDNGSGTEPPAPLTYRMWKPPMAKAEDTDREFLMRSRGGANRDANPDMLHGLAGAWISGPSQLVFEVPQRLAPIPFEIDQLIQFCAHSLDLVVAPGVAASTDAENEKARAQMMIDGQLEPILGHYPGGLHQNESVPYTSIEFPALLNISPYRSARWRLRPDVSDRRDELWAFELEQPKDAIAPGAPRYVRPSGHLFAFGWRSADEVRWPVADPASLNNQGDQSLKYSAAERPKTSLYEATRRLLVKQLYDDNGDITADRFRLSALGTTARLHYKPALDVPQDDNIEGVRQRSETDASNGDKPKEGDEGILSEWQQKTETGRDFYSKESFAGFFMPFGFRAEVVTITERLFCSLNDRPASKSSIRVAVDQTPPDERLVDLHDDEAELTAFLVARKFCRFRGSRIRRFTEPESADFSEVTGQAGRAIGLQQVEVLVERTPVLANQATNAGDDPGSQVAAIQSGADVVVDAGAGIDSAREIFWPRVQDFVPDDQGNLMRRLVVYKFPVRFTFLDGSTQTTEMPMLFVPTLSKGEALYPNAKDELRTTPIGAKIPVVQPSPPAVLAPGHLGSADEVARVGSHLQKFLPQSFKALAIGTPAQMKAGVSAALTEGLNLSLGNLATEIARRVTNGEVVDAIKMALDAGNSGFQSQIQEILAASGVPETRVPNIVDGVTRTIAWGEEITATIDATASAERLSRLLAPPVGELAPEFAKIRSSVEAIQDELGDLKSLPAEAQRQLATDLTNLSDAAGKGPTRYIEVLRQFLVHWAVWLGASFQRSDWDDCFCAIAKAFEPDVEKKAQTAALQKEIQRALLRGTPCVEIGDVDILLPDMPEGFPAVVVTGLSKCVDNVLIQVGDAAKQNVDVLTGVVNGLVEAAGAERGLVRRSQYLLQDLATLGEDVRHARVDHLMADIGCHFSFDLTHHEQGRVRWERFLQNALSGEELIRQARSATISELTAVQDPIREHLKKAVSAVQKLEATEVENVATVQHSVKRLLLTANPEQLTQKLQNFVSLTGARLTQDLHDAFDRNSSRIRQFLVSLKTRPDAESSDRQIRPDLQELFALAEGIVEQYRGTFQNLVANLRPRLQSWVNRLTERDTGAAEIETFAKQLVAYAQAAPVNSVSWRVGAASIALIEEVQRTAAMKTFSNNSPLQSTLADLAQTSRDLTNKINQQFEVPAQKLKDVQSRLASIAGGFDAQLQSRINALANLTDRWITDVTSRGDDLIAHLFVILSTLQVSAEGLFNELLVEFLGDLGPQALDFVLKEIPGAAETVARVRRLVGEGEDFEKRIDRVTGDLRKQWDDLDNIGNTLADDFKKRIEHVEGDFLAMAKRAALSLPSPALLSQFEDQTRKAIFDTAEVLFSVKTVGDGIRSFVAHPNLASLNIKIPGIDGNKVIQHADDYLKSGLRDAQRSANEVFADVIGKAQTAAINAGLGNVVTEVNALSREAGNLAREARTKLAEIHEEVKDAMADLRTGVGTALSDYKAKAKELEVQAATLLPVDPKLFNVLPLQDILSVVKSPGDLPKTIAHEFPDRIERTFSFSQETQTKDLAVIKFSPVDKCRLKIDSHAIVWLPAPGRKPQPPSYSVRGQLDAFALEIATLLRINFASLSFTSENGSFRCIPKLGKVTKGDGNNNDQVNTTEVVEFLGSLEFVNDLRKTLGQLLADNGLILRVENDTVLAGMRIRIPDITLGAVAVTNLTISMALSLPLGSGPLRYRFALSDPFETFRIAVTIFAGGGFFALELASQPELCSVEVALEFGGSLSLSLGIASGSVSVMAGLYYKWGGNATIFSGYFRLCGNVNVLGFIEVSIVIYLALDYRKQGDQTQLHGRATITISVKIGIFSKSFALTYEKNIAGSNSNSTAYLSRTEMIARADDEIKHGSRLAMLESFPANYSGIRIAHHPVESVEQGHPANSGKVKTASFVKQSGPPRFSDAMDEEDFKKYWIAFDDAMPFPTKLAKSPAKKSDGRRQ